MNRNRRYLYIAGLLALAAILFWLWPRERPVAQFHDSNSATTGNGGGQAPSWTERLPDPRSLKKPDDVNEEDWNTFLRNRAIAEASNRNILFYGKVVDQNGDPVAGARIKATAVSRTGVARVLTTGKGQSKNQLEATTAQNGLFKMDGGKGFALNFKKIECDGYVLSPQVESQFMYGQLLREPSSSRFHHPDPAKPVVFRMWKLGELEPLIVARHGYLEIDKNEPRLHRPCADLLKMKFGSSPVPGTDLIFKIIDRDGSVHLIAESVNGGIKAAMNEDFLFEAPDSGYQQQIDVTEILHNGRRGPFRCYMKLRNGAAYAACHWSVIGYDGGAWRISVRELRINPNGSRNLQYDGTNKIRPGFR